MPTVTSRDGTLISYTRTGRGPTLILVDGALCSRTMGPMPKLAPLLASGFTVFTYDRRGRGESGDTRPYSVAREVEDLETLIGEAGGEASLLGLSSGAALALEATASGLSVDKLVLYEPPFVAHGSSAAPVNHETRLKEFIAADRRAEALRYFMVDMVNMPSIFMVVMRLMFPVWWKLKSVAHTLPYDAAILRDFRVPTERAAKVRVPTLVLAGQKTQPRLIAAASELAKSIPGSRYLTLKGQTHNVDAKVLAPVVAGFLESGQASGGEVNGLRAITT